MSRLEGSSWLEELDPATLDQAVAALDQVARTGGRMLVAGHVRPDGDALGSVLALHLAARAAGADSIPAIGEAPLELVPELAALPGAEQLRDATALPAADELDLVVTADAAAPDRLGAVAPLLESAPRSIVLDHHARGQSFGELRLVAPGAAATVQVVAHLLDRLGWPIDEDIASCLYVGLVTDTGRFSYEAADASALELGARLVAAGVDHVGWNRRLFETISFSQLLVLRAALANLVLVDPPGLIHTHLTAEDLAATGDPSVPTDAVIDVIRTVDTARAALVLTPDEQDAWRASMRSAGDLDVGAVAAALGGGGHRLAAGFTMQGPPEEIVTRVLALLEEEG